jgi:NRPS condensation-like uncharacterized protein
MIKTTLVDDVILAMTSSVGDLQIHCIVIFANKVDVGCLTQAILLTMKIEPVLGCRLVNNGWRSRWRSWEYADTENVFTLVEAEDTELALHEFLVEPCQAMEDPLVRVRIIRASNDTLCIKMNHMAADAGGVKEYLYLLAECYQKLTENPVFTIQPEFYRSRQITQVLRQFSVFDKANIFVKLLWDFKQFFRPYRLWPLLTSEGRLSNKRFLIRHICTEQFLEIKAYAVTQGVTINDVVISACFRALYRLLELKGNCRLSLGMTVDLRRYLSAGKGESICNLCNVACPRIDYDPDDRFEQTLCKVHDHLEALKANYIGAGELLMIPLLNIFPSRFRQRFFSAMYTKFSYLMPPIVTNMGQMNAERVYFGDSKVTDAFLVSPLTYHPYVLLGVSGFGSTLTLSCGFCQDDENKNTEIINRLLDYLINEILGASKNQPAKVSD